jgi:glutaredoxin-related protein
MVAPEMATAHTERPILDQHHRTSDATQTMLAFHTETMREVLDAIEREPVVVVGMAGNPFVRKARAALVEAGVEFRYLEYGGYLSQWRRRLAIKMWSGWPTFPQVFVRGTLIGGFEDTRDALSDGSLKATLK